MPFTVAPLLIVTRLLVVLASPRRPLEKVVDTFSSEEPPFLLSCKSSTSWCVELEVPLVIACRYARPASQWAGE